MTTIISSQVVVKIVVVDVFAGKFVLYCPPEKKTPRKFLLAERKKSGRY